MRYFLELSYRGTSYSGWQRQPHSLSVQQVIEEALGLLLRGEVPIVGCGRTDAGVHASYYVAHFEWDAPLPEWLLYRLNQVLPPDISIRDIQPVNDQTHARFDATRRGYAYYISWQKNPFLTETAWHHPSASKFRLDVLNEAAALLMEYQHFYPFCKSGSDVRTMACTLYRSEWEQRIEDGLLVYHIAANRFLRGMVRLIVGMCVNVAKGKVQLGEVRAAMNRQERLTGSESAPPEGLFLTEVSYPLNLFQSHRPNFEGGFSS